MKLCVPSLTFHCLNCSRVAHPDLTGLAACDWSQVNSADLGHWLQSWGWVIDSDGYTFCSHECQAIFAIESDTRVRNLQHRLRQAMETQRIAANN